MMFKREATEEMEITSFEPPRSYTLGCESHGCRYETTFTLSAEGDGTDVELHFEARPLTVTAKVLGVLTRPLIKMCAKEVAKDLDDLKETVEATRGSQSV